MVKGSPHAIRLKEVEQFLAFLEHEKGMAMVLRQRWMTGWRRMGVLTVMAAGLLTLAAGPLAAQELTVYSGRSKSFMDHLLNAFEKDTGIRVRRVYGGTAEIALRLHTEGNRSPADLFLAQDAGALGALSKAGLFAELPETLTERVDARFVSARNDWVATSLRARTLAYSSQRVSAEELPKSVFDLTDPKYRGRVGWSPANAGFQAFVSAMRLTHGEEKTAQWLAAMKANGTKSYARNTVILEGIAAGEIDFGLPNHYYLVRYKIGNAQFPVEQTQFEKDDVGNLFNIAGAGILKTARNPEAAQKLVDYLLSDKGQAYFVGEIYEFPVVEGVILHRNHGDLDAWIGNAPAVDLNKIDDLDGTLKLLRDAGLL